MPLTNLQVKKAKGMEKPQKLADGGGLYLLVQPNGNFNKDQAIFLAYQGLSFSSPSTTKYDSYRSRKVSLASR